MVLPYENYNLKEETGNLYCMLNVDCLSNFLIDNKGNDIQGTRDG